MAGNTNNVSNSQLKLARLIHEVLGYKVILEATWKWLVFTKSLYVDIYIPCLNLVIEYQGPQHFFFPNHVHRSYREFLKQKERDKCKKKLLKQNGIRFMEWRYSDRVTLKNLVRRFDKLGVHISDDVRERAATEVIPRTRRRRKRGVGRKSSKKRTYRNHTQAK